MDDKETGLVRRAGNGDRNAFWCLVEPCQRVAFSVAARILNNAADAEDATQEAVLKAFRNIHRFRGEARFSTWLIQITINEARMRLRRERRALHHSLEECFNADADGRVQANLEDWREVPSNALHHDELRHALQRAFHSLPAKYREVLTLRDVKQCSIEQTARALGLSRGNVKTRLRRARLRMREALAPAFSRPWTQSKFDLLSLGWRQTS